MLEDKRSILARFPILPFVICNHRVSQGRGRILPRMQLDRWTEDTGSCVTVAVEEPRLKRMMLKDKTDWGYRWRN